MVKPGIRPPSGQQLSILWRGNLGDLLDYGYLQKKIRMHGGTGFIFYLILFSSASCWMERAESNSMILC
ncbi:hypothetical protein PAMA110636_05705 [Paenibacillus macerans]|nr:hypothetical protein PbJCM17693_42900 [Paenibacillus macerans]